MTDDVNVGIVFTTKEMLIRMDGKLDVLAANQNHFDVELALLKARAEKLESELRDKSRYTEDTLNALEKELISTKQRQDKILTRINMAAGAVGLVVFVAPFLFLILQRVWGM